MNQEATTLYALELSARQSARTLEQAVRHRAVVELRPRIAPDDEPIHCRLEAVAACDASPGRGPCLRLVPLAPGEHPDDDLDDDHDDVPRERVPGRAAPLETYARLVGTYCDATLRLGEHRYVFSTDVVGVRARPSVGSPELHVARPDVLQVRQRRRFWRFEPAQSAQVHLRWSTNDQPFGTGVGWLCNVSPDGLACRVQMRVADQLQIGDELRADLALVPGESEPIHVEVALCNKTPGGSEGAMILGLQVLRGEGHEDSARGAELLRRQLLSRYAPIADASTGEDR